MPCGWHVCAVALRPWLLLPSKVPDRSELTLSARDVLPGWLHHRPDTVPRWQRMPTKRGVCSNPVCCWLLVHGCGPVCHGPLPRGLLLHAGWNRQRSGPLQRWKILPFRVHCATSVPARVFLRRPCCCHDTVHGGVLLPEERDGDAHAGAFNLLQPQHGSVGAHAVPRGVPLPQRRIIPGGAVREGVLLPVRAHAVPHNLRGRVPLPVRCDERPVAVQHWVLLPCGRLRHG